MTQRINGWQKAQHAFKALGGFGMYLSKSSLDQTLLHLVYYRVSQINGCAFCLDMHSKDLKASGESEQRLHMVAAWREAPQYTAREKAALAYAEALTRIADSHLDDAVYENALTHFSEAELIDLTIGIIAINSYNRFNVALPGEIGSYVPGQFAKTA
jgi:alkylhydroperoxidase AhpD family core domain